MKLAPVIIFNLSEKSHLIFIFNYNKLKRALSKSFNFGAAIHIRNPI